MPRDTITHFRLVVGTGVEPVATSLYLPFISRATDALRWQKSGFHVSASGVISLTGMQTATGLRLAWTPPDGSPISSYRVYRVARSHPTPVLVAQPLAMATAVHLPAVGDSLCDALFFVTVVRGEEESDASALSYATGACP